MEDLTNIVTAVALNFEFFVAMRTKKEYKIVENE